MLYHLFEYLDRNYDLVGTGLFRYITFRSGAAIILSLIISMAIGKRIISSLTRLQIGESVRNLGLAGEKTKAGTPTMGGIIIILSIVIPTLLLARLDNIYIILLLVSTLWMATIGFIDDYIKVFRKDKAGLKGVFKVLGQIGLGIIVAATMLWHKDITVRMPAEQVNGKYKVVEQFTDPEDGVQVANVKTTLTNVPFLKGNQLDYQVFVRWFAGDNAKNWAWLIFIPFVIFVVTAVSNGANLTDGLDGLATGVSAIIGATLGILAYVSGNKLIADYLNIFYLPNSQEIVIFSASFLGACVGFLWHNAYPARVFMGDTGSLTLGGIIAAMAILLRKELLIPILCGIFLVENLSVVLQVSYFKYTKRKYGEGRRLFRMAPLHHHYQKGGMPESRIVIHFWIVAIMLAVITLITLKVR
ncbi:MAG: phospho-N-acetylmuramoyl-pentapeptide-transferase [Lewinellaceae bacterium]|nr:phospho-N-acetylmuramoyl-pentapeptide-transferase [Lewinellaceae bacterium]